MDWDKEWEKIASEKFNRSSKLDKKAIMEAITHESQMPLAKLKFSLKAKLYWGLFFIAAFALLMIIFRENLNMVLTFGFLVLWYVTGLLFMQRHYRSLAKLDENMSANIQEVLRQYRSRVKAALHFEELWGTSFFPIAILCGLLLPLFYRGMTLTEIIRDAEILLVALGAMVVIIPLAIYSGKAMNKVAFDKYLKQVENNLQRLEASE